MDPDSLETVVIAYRPAQLAVLLSLFEWYGIPAHAPSYHQIYAQWPYAIALGGVAIQVPAAFAEEARDLMARVADQPAAEPAPRQPAGYLLFKALTLPLCLMLGMIPPPKIAASIVGR